MAAKAVTREDGVLKLVHLGGYVELYWEPITAHEVLEKNPHHSVTRPDFWRYPWVVIQPDSILKPGRVFYIIPNHVVFDLVKAYRLRNQLASLKHRNQSPKQSAAPVDSGTKVNPIHRDHRFLQRQLSLQVPVKTTTTKQVADRRVEMDNEQQQRPHKHLLQKIRSWSRNKPTYTCQEHDQFLKEFQYDSCCEMVPEHEINDRCKHLSSKSPSWVESWLELTTKQRHHRQESLDDSWLEVRPPNPSEYVIHNGNCSENPAKPDQGECCKQVKARKSCLRSQSAYFDRKSSGRRVTFDLPRIEQKGRKFQDF